MSTDAFSHADQCRLGGVCTRVSELPPTGFAACESVELEVEVADVDPKDVPAALHTKTDGQRDRGRGNERQEPTTMLDMALLQVSSLAVIVAVPGARQRKDVRPNRCSGALVRRNGSPCHLVSDRWRQLRGQAR